MLKDFFSHTPAMFLCSKSAIALFCQQILIVHRGEGGGSCKYVSLMQHMANPLHKPSSQLECVHQG